jgi:hypothetical protein
MCSDVLTAVLLPSQKYLEGEKTVGRDVFYSTNEGLSKHLALTIQVSSDMTQYC